MKKRMIIVTALIMGTLGAGCVSVQASDTLPELTKDNALEQMMKAGETDSLVSNHKSYEATCEYILQNTKDRKSTRLNSSHASKSRMPSSA